MSPQCRHNGQFFRHDVRKPVEAKTDARYLYTSLQWRSTPPGHPLPACQDDQPPDGAYLCYGRTGCVGGRRRLTDCEPDRKKSLGCDSRAVPPPVPWRRSTVVLPTPPFPEIRMMRAILPSYNNVESLPRRTSISMAHLRCPCHAVRLGELTFWGTHGKISPQEEQPGARDRVRGSHTEEGSGASGGLLHSFPLRPPG